MSLCDSCKYSVKNRNYSSNRPKLCKKDEAETCLMAQGLYYVMELNDYKVNPDKVERNKELIEGFERAIDELEFCSYYRKKLFTKKTECQYKSLIPFIIQ